MAKYAICSGLLVHCSATTHQCFKILLTVMFIFEFPKQGLGVANRRLSRSAQETATAEKENRALKQTLKYLQAELVKAGKKVQQQ